MFTFNPITNLKDIVKCFQKEQSIDKTENHTSYFLVNIVEQQSLTIFSGRLSIAEPAVSQH